CGGDAGSLARLLARCHVPQLDRPVPAPRGQRLAVWTEGHGQHLASVLLEGGPFLTRRHVPQLELPVLARRGQRFAVWTEGHGVHNARESPERGLGSSGVKCGTSENRALAERRGHQTNGTRT